MATSLGRRSRSTFDNESARDQDSPTLVIRPKRARYDKKPPKLSYLDKLHDNVLRQIVRHCVFAGSSRPPPNLEECYKDEVSVKVARTALSLLRCSPNRIGDIARDEFRVVKETEKMPVSGEGLQLCTKKPADYQALERLLKVLDVHTLVLEVNEIPRRYSKLVRRAMPNVRKLSMHFSVGNRGHELERILAVTVPLDTFEADFEETDRSYIVALVRHVKAIKQLRISFAGKGSIKNNITLMPVWLAARDALREVELMSIWGDRFDAVNTLVRACRMSRVTVNGQLIRP